MLWLFVSITFHHELKVGRVSIFLELAPQTILRYGTKPGRFVVGVFGVVISQNKTVIRRF